MTKSSDPPRRQTGQRNAGDRRRYSGDGSLARLLREKRFSRGSLDFDFQKPKSFTGLDGRLLMFVAANAWRATV